MPCMSRSTTECVEGDGVSDSGEGHKPVTRRSAAAAGSPQALAQGCARSVGSAHDVRVGVATGLLAQILDVVGTDLALVEGKHGLS